MSRILLSLSTQQSLPKSGIRTSPYVAMDRREEIISDAERENGFRTGSVFYLSDRPANFREQFSKAQKVRAHNKVRPEAEPIQGGSLSC